MAKTRQVVDGGRIALKTMDPSRTLVPLETEDALIEQMTRPAPEVVEAVSAIDGEVLILGAGGKMGPSLAGLLIRAGARGVVGVSRFSESETRERLEAGGVRTIRCDLLDDGDLQSLPEAAHIILLAGSKFGTTGSEPGTWAINSLMPARVVQRFPTSRLVYVSTGNVYGVTQTALGGASESSDEDPVGEYAASRLGGERLVTYYSALQQTPAVIIRLFYATELRYGIVLDVARKVWRRRPIDLTVGHVNQIWQGDANAYLARCFPLCDSPPPVYNLTGPETLSIRRLAARLGHFMGVEPIFEGTESEASLLGNADKLISLLGPPEVDMEAVVEWVASWVMHGGRVLDKPTMYERRDGRF